MKSYAYLLMWSLLSSCLTAYAGGCWWWSKSKNNSTASTSTAEVAAGNPVLQSSQRVVEPEEQKTFVDKETQTKHARKIPTENPLFADTPQERQEESCTIETVEFGKPTVITIRTNSPINVSIGFCTENSTEQPFLALPDVVAQSSKNETIEYTSVWHHLPAQVFIKEIIIRHTPQRTTYDTQTTTTTRLTRSDKLLAAGKHMITFIHEQKQPAETATYFWTKQTQTCTWETETEHPSIPVEILVTEPPSAAGVAAVIKMRYRVAQV